MVRHASWFSKGEANHAMAEGKKTMRMKHVSGQGEFEFGFLVRRAVESLRRWTAKGKLAKVGYEAWLEYYTPLCSRGEPQRPMQRLAAAILDDAIGAGQLGFTAFGLKGVGK